MKIKARLHYKEYTPKFAAVCLVVDNATADIIMWQEKIMVSRLNLDKRIRSCVQRIDDKSSSIRIVFEHCYTLDPGTLVQHLMQAGELSWTGELVIAAKKGNRETITFSFVTTPLSALQR